MTCECIRVTYWWHMSTNEWHTDERRMAYVWHTSKFEWHTDDIQVHTSDTNDTRVHTNDIWVHTDNIRAHTSEMQMTYEWRANDIRIMKCNNWNNFQHYLW